MPDIFQNILYIAKDILFLSAFAIVLYYFYKKLRMTYTEFIVAYFIASIICIFNN